MKNSELEQLINDKLNSAAISDFAPNGLQVEGRETVHKIVTGVTACQALLDEAVRLQADAVIVLDGKTFAPKPSREAQQNGYLYLKGGSAGPCYAIDGPGEIFGPAQTLCLVEE